jgi:hypothetical protein
MLRVELRDGSLNLYQYAWLERVQFLPAEEADNMTLFFNRQSVRITGKRLRELVSPFQRMAVEWVKEQSEQFDSIGTSGGAWVDGIQIVEKTPSLKADGERLK